VLQVRSHFIAFLPESLLPDRVVDDLLAEIAIGSFLWRHIDAGFKDVFSQLCSEIERIVWKCDALRGRTRCWDLNGRESKSILAS
jgi:hypothetical protein